VRILCYALEIALLCVFARWWAWRVVYQGSASVPDPAVASALGVQDVWLRAEDGTKIHGWWVRSEGSRLATLFLHGNAGNIGYRGNHIHEIVAAGSDLLIIDYRGFGRSQGRPSESGLAMDADAGYPYVAAQGKPVVIHGESIGSAVAVDLATRRHAAGLILEAPFTSLKAEASHVLRAIGPLLVWGYDSKTRIARVHAPLLVIHGDHDGVVPYPLGRELYEAAPEPKSFWTVKGAGHNDIVETAGGEYRERLRRFYAGL
jgi:fermentation-respiration switch protein FrsA (DUF1100 family)